MQRINEWMGTGDKTVLHLQVTRFLRSISQGIAVVDLTLYLRELGWSATAIGGVLAAAAVIGAALILFVGILSDRFGRKPFLLVYESLTTLCSLLLILTASPVILSIVIILTGFGRGQNGAAGPFTPAEQAWMTAHIARADRGRIFSINTALGFFGMAIGALLAGLPHFWTHIWAGALAYRPLFGLIFLLSLVGTIVIATAPGTRSRPQQEPRIAVTDAAPASDTPGEKAIRRRENGSMAKLAIVNTLNGLAIGFFGPLMSYWFATRFGVSAAAIGVTLALSFAFTGISSIITGGLAQRFGMVRSVVWLQLTGIVFILVMPLMPSFWLASILYIARSAVSRGTQGAQSALSTSLTRDHRRGFSVSMNALTIRLASVIGPVGAGYLIDLGDFAVPFYIAGALQLASTLLYGRLFGTFDEKGSD